MKEERAMLLKVKTTEDHEKCVGSGLGNLRIIYNILHSENMKNYNQPCARAHTHTHYRKI
jgi:hypothetical protein